MRFSSILKCLAFTAALSVTAVSAQAAIYQFAAFLDGPSENPPNASPGTGFASVVIDDIANTIAIQASFSGLTGITTVAHIHCCTAPPGNIGVAVTPGTLTGFPVGVTSGVYSNSFDTTLASTYTAGFITNFAGSLGNAEATLINALLAGEAYFNIHTNLSPAGEIRGFLQETPIPGALPLFVSGIGVLGFLSVRRQRRRAPV